MKHFGDITKLSGGVLPIVDVITGGSPCQDLSVAGKRAGLAGERSGLFMEQMRIVKEMRERDVRDGRPAQYVRPRYMVWENVPGAFSSGSPKGSDFQAVLEEIVRVVCKEATPVPIPKEGWPKSGCISGVGDSGCTFSIAWRVHDAQFWGVPQRRKRIALVADFGGLSAPEILFERKGLSGDSEPCGAAREETAGAVGGGVESASYSIDKAITTGGNCTAGGDCVHKEYAPALTTDRPHGVAYGASSYDSNSMKSPNPHSGIYEADTARTLDHNGGSPACNQGGIAIVRTYQDVTGTLNPGAHPGSYNGQDAYNDMLIAASLSARDYKGPCAQDLGNNMANYPIQNSVVRRLTPLECERLQGYPDGWTDIGEWTDSNGKKHKDADSPRYKAIGNSIALPFWAWLARRICAQYERPATMASLFDGIGGFPLAFQRSGAVPVWASEIEEFPIAVTKKHFPEE